MDKLARMTLINVYYCVNDMSTRARYNYIRMSTEYGVFVAHGYMSLRFGIICKYYIQDYTSRQPINKYLWKNYEKNSRKLCFWKGYKSTTQCAHVLGDYTGLGYLEEELCSFWVPVVVKATHCYQNCVDCPVIDRAPNGLSITHPDLKYDQVMG